MPSDADYQAMSGEYPSSRIAELEAERDRALKNTEYVAAELREVQAGFDKVKAERDWLKVQVSEGLLREAALEAERDQLQERVKFVETMYDVAREERTSYRAALKDITYSAGREQEIARNALKGGTV